MTYDGSNFPCAACGSVLRASCETKKVAEQLAFMLGWRGLGEDWYCPACWRLRTTRPRQHSAQCPGHPCSCRRPGRLRFSYKLSDGDDDVGGDAVADQRHIP
jgi:hypothetical protein